MPRLPSALRACHHLPELSTMSRISPLVNEISFGSSGEAESVRECVNADPASSQRASQASMGAKHVQE